MKPYYDHDAIWRQRVATDNPVWGSYSHVVYSEVLRRLEALALSDKVVLDVGCGAGAFGERAKAAGFAYYGCDHSAVAIELGRKHFRDVQLMVADFALAELPVLFHGEKFPVLTCINALHCLVGAPERQLLLSNMRRVCREPGYLVLTTMIGPVDLAARDERIARAYKSPDEISGELGGAGWEITETEVEQPKNRSQIANLIAVCRTK